MKIEILDHNFSQVTDIALDDRHAVNAHMSYLFQMYNSRSKEWKREKIYLINETGRFLTGLVPYLEEELALRKIAYTKLDQRYFPKIEYKVPELRGVNLRSYQIEYLGKALRQRRMIVDSITGSGKTTMMAAILDTLGLATLIIAPSATVQVQLMKELQEMLPYRRFGIVGGGKTQIAPVTIGLSGSLKKLSDMQLKAFELLLVDDAHISAANQTESVILRQAAPYRFGFTGTSKGRSDNKDLVVHGLLGQPIRVIEHGELVKKGYLANVATQMYYGNWQGNFSILEDFLIVQNPVRNKLIQKIIQEHRGRSVLIVVRRLDHGELFQKMFKGSVFVSGEIKDMEERERIRQDVKDGKIKILITSNVGATGLDIPNLDVGINAAGGKGEIITQQKIGRMMRPFKDVCKKWFDIYDCYHPTLEEHAKQRYRIYKENGIKVELIGFPPKKQERIETDEQ